MTALVATALALSGTACLVSVLTWIQTRRMPAGAVSTSLVNLEARLERIELRQATWKAELENLQEGVLDALDRAETKRKRVAASESRRNAAENGEPAQLDLTGDRATVIGNIRAMRAQVGM